MCCVAGAPSFICAALYVRESCHNLNLILLFRLLMYTKKPFVWLCWLCLLFFFLALLGFVFSVHKRGEMQAYIGTQRKLTVRAA